MKIEIEEHSFFPPLKILGNRVITLGNHIYDIDCSVTTKFKIYYSVPESVTILPTLLQHARVPVFEIKDLYRAHGGCIGNQNCAHGSVSMCSSLYKDSNMLDKPSVFEIKGALCTRCAHFGCRVHRYQVLCILQVHAFSKFSI